MLLNNKRVAIEFISVLGMPPVQFVELAAEMGRTYIGMGLDTMYPDNALGYANWSLRSDPTLRRELKRACSQNGVSISIGEGFVAFPDRDVSELASALDIMAELEAAYVNFVSIDRDKERALDQCARFAELASERGLNALIEFMPGFALGDLTSAVDAVRHSGSKTFHVLIDAMHFFRSASRLEDLAGLPPGVVGYVQLCDVPKTSKYDSYTYEAWYERLPPGRGDLPLAELIATAPKDVFVGLECPMLTSAEAGVDAIERLEVGLRAINQLLQNPG